MSKITACPCCGKATMKCSNGQHYFVSCNQCGASGRSAYVWDFDDGDRTSPSNPDGGWAIMVAKAEQEADAAWRAISTPATK